MTRIVAAIEYDGTAYRGWQIQPHAPSVQQALEQAISNVADKQVRVIGAGRTDTGVHALGQVIHFDTEAVRSPREWVLGTNTALPVDVRVLWAIEVGDDFHARYSAVERSYRYVIANKPVAPALDRDRAWWIHHAIDAEVMKVAAQDLVGEHDFSAFRASACQSSSPMRHVRSVGVQRDGDRIVVDIRANAFLHHMVRNIVGSLVRIGRAMESPSWISMLLERRDRTRAGMTAPAHGLYLTGVAYPDSFDLAPPCYTARV